MTAYLLLMVASILLAGAGLALDRLHVLVRAVLLVAAAALFIAALAAVIQNGVS